MLPLAVLVIVLLLLAGGTLLTIGASARIHSLRNAQQIKARSAADSGLTKALWEMNHKLEIRNFHTGTLSDGTIQSLPNCDAVFSYSIKNNSDSTYSISSSGQCGNVTERVYAIVGLQGLFDSAILAKDKITLMPNTRIKGYNSADLSDSDFEVTVGTTSVEQDKISLSSGTVVEGDVFVGVGGDPDLVIGDGGTITGEKYSLITEPYMPDITPPSLAAVSTPLSAKGVTVTLSPSESGVYTSIDLSQGGGNVGILEIQGGDVVLHITGDINMENGCELVVRPGSTLSLYVDGDICIKNSACINNQAGNVTDLKLYGSSTGQQVFNLMAKSAVFGTVYAPNADVAVYPNAEMYGAIVGQNVDFKSGSVFYYDEALRNVKTDDVGARFVIKRWHEDE